MKPLTKVVIVTAGYVAAFLAAWAIVAVYEHMTRDTGVDTSGGMYAFGISLLFVGVFAVAAIPASVAMLVFLRPHPWFWRAASATALVVAGVAVVGVTTFWKGAMPMPGTVERWTILAGATVLIAPVFVLAFGLAGLFAPNRRSRFALLGAMAIETAAFGVMILRWLIA
jgi:hypothetical protein